MTPLIVENGPPVTFLRRKMTGGPFSMGVVIRRYTGLWRFYLSTDTICSSYECFILMARRLSSKLLKQGYPVERSKASFRKLYGRYWDLIQQYELSFSRMLNNILTLDQLQWLPSRSSFPPISCFNTELDLHQITSRFYGAIATGMACQQGTLTHPDTWFLPPVWDLLMLQLLGPDFPNFPCLYSTFHLEYPSVLSRFCFGVGYNLACTISLCEHSNIKWNSSPMIFCKLHNVQILSSLGILIYQTTSIGN